MSGWSIHEPTWEWQYVRNGEILVRVPVESWDSFRLYNDVVVVKGFRIPVPAHPTDLFRWAAE